MSLRIERFRPSTTTSLWIPSLSKPIQYEKITFTNKGTGTLTVSGNGTSSVSIFKTSGSAAWDTGSYISTGYTAPITVEFYKTASAADDGISYAMLSLNADPTASSSYTTLDYASYPYATSNYYLYNNGSAINPSITWSSSTKLYMVYGTDGYIRHYNGATQLYSVNYGIGNTVYVDSSFYSVNATNAGFIHIRVTKNTWNGTQYI